jgi:hypothetical protein
MTPINFAVPFAGAPVIFSQVQGAGDPHWVRTRQRNAGPAGFEVAMEEEENKATPHGLETIGWMAIEFWRGACKSGKSWSCPPWSACMRHADQAGGSVLFSKWLK